VAVLRKFRFPLYVGAALFAVVLCYPGGLEAAFSSAGELSRLNSEMEQLKSERTRLDREAVVVANRIAIKELLVEELIGGRKCLREISSKFEVLNADEPGYMHVMQSHFPGASSLECSARNVLSYAEQRSGHGSTKEVVMREMCRQFRSMFPAVECEMEDSIR